MAQAQVVARQQDTVGLGPTAFQGLDTQSGDVSTPVVDLPAGATVATANATVSGHAFHGDLGDLAGARVTKAQVIWAGGQTASPSGGTLGWIVDFGRSVSVLALALGKGQITLVLPWLGTDFAPRPVFPTSSSTQTPASPGSASVGLTGVETLKLFIQTTGATELDCTITTGTVPVNVRASVNGRLPFWTRPGPLPDTPTAIDGLAAELTAVAAGGAATATLTLTSDTTGVMEVSAPAPAVDRSAAAQWGSAASTAVQLQALEETVVAVPLSDGGDSANWTVSRLSVNVSGAFPPWRAHPLQATASPGLLGLRVDATFSAARRLAVPSKVWGIALPLRVSAAAEVHVALVADAGGVPGSAKPLAEAVITPAIADLAWYEAQFASPVAVKDGAWIVVQAKTGAVEWAAAAEESSAATRTLGAAGGARWDRFPPVRGGVAVGQARLLREPFATENDPLLTLRWATASAALDAGSASLAASVISADHVLSLSITALASGTLTLGPATASYRR